MNAFPAVFCKKFAEFAEKLRTFIGMIQRISFGRVTIKSDKIISRNPAKPFPCEKFWIAICLN
ncbi:MAG: hypothetical protein AAB869_01590, partial [Patescibacteria group bacterium]